ncbi:MAG: thiol peroxidase [Planctomycetota bacterium]|jgi:thiol peroxidase|nr:thiol peroxidase [Planctomycetota bacterium]
MASVTFKGTPVAITGDLPAVGSAVPAFTAVGGDLSEISPADFAGKQLILNIFPSIDTGVCATSVRSFNEQAGGKDGVVVLCLSMDLPFAMTRFCGAEGIEGVQVGSLFRDQGFAASYGAVMTEGPLKGLTARAVLVVGADGVIKHVELVPEIAQEPDYAAALAALG